MFAEWLLLAASLSGSGPAPGTTPSLGPATTASFNTGACNTDGSVGQPAAVQVSWSITNPDDANYRTNIYKDGALVASQPTSVTTFDMQAQGLVEGNRFNRQMLVWNFRVDVVRLSDGGQVSSQIAPSFHSYYGTCS